MHKPAPTDFPIHDLIRSRWSPRAFSDKPVDREILASMFEAARWAPSSNNEQPWAYLVATKDNPEDFAKTVSVLVEFNASWAKEAAVLVLAVSRLNFPNGNPNRNAFYDTGAASISAKPRSHRTRPRRSPNGRIRSRQSQTSLRNSRGLRTDRSHRHWLSRRYELSFRKAPRSRNCSANTQAFN